MERTADCYGLEAGVKHQQRIDAEYHRKAENDHERRVMALGGLKELRRGRRREATYIQRVRAQAVKDDADYVPSADSSSLSPSSDEREESDDESDDESGTEQTDTSESYDSESDVAK